MNNLFEIVYEDADLLVVNKPAGLVCHPTKTDEYSSLISRARLYLGPESRPQLIHRLDRETSGVTVLAKNEVAARKLRRLWEQRLVRKEYCAIVQGQFDPPYQLIAAPLGKDATSVVAIKDCVRSDGAEAKTEAWLVKTFTRTAAFASGRAAAFGPAQANAGGVLHTGQELQPTPGVNPPEREAVNRIGDLASRGHFSVLRVLPQTGRKHQIRIHLAHIGHPIVGDKLYGGEEDLYLALVENRLTQEQKDRLLLPYHALHAAEVGFEWNGRDRSFRAAPEPWFSRFCAY